MGWIARKPRRRNLYYVVPFARNNTSIIFISNEEFRKHKLDVHKIVRCAISQTSGHKYEARILEVFEDINSPSLEREIVEESQGFPSAFPQTVIKKSKQLKITSASQKHRQDLRNTLHVTIDGEDAKDFDDAICVTKHDNGSFNLKVSIADVAHFVNEADPIDTEAAQRGTSIYLPGSVVPMLPEVLSNDLCSLRPREDRLCLTCEIEIGPDAEILSRQIYPSIIISKARLTYTQVQAAISQGARGKIPSKIFGMLQDAFELNGIVNKRRRLLGSLDLDLPEMHLDVDYKTGAVKTLTYRQRNDAHRLIENFMVLANEMVAEAFEETETPCIFRVHEEPDPEKIKGLVKVLQHFKVYKAKQAPPNAPWDFQQLLDKIESHKKRYILCMSILRSLKQARYSSYNLQHFGLASPSYCHFTSPIRRYPDLMVHRILWQTNFLQKPSRHSQASLETLAQSCSEKEQRAVAAERQMKAMKACRFMEDQVGHDFEAHIVSVQSFGFFISLTEIPVEGLVPIRTLGLDRWRLDEHQIRLEGPHTRQYFQLGDKIRVKLIEVDRLRAQMAFRYLGHLQEIE